MLQPAPPRLLQPDGSLLTGMWAGPLGDVDLLDAHPPGLPGPLARLRLKRWQHICVVHEDVALTFAVVDARFLKLGWVQVIDRATGERLEHHVQSPALDVRLARALHDDRCHLRSRKLRIELHNFLAGGRHHALIDATQRGRDAVHADITLHADWTPLVVNLPLPDGATMYSHKVVLPVSGRIRVGERALDCDPASTFAIIDVHQAHYPRQTWWKWATFVGRSGDHAVGVNLTRNVVVGDELHENALWVDGELQPLSPARFDLPAEGPWTMGTADGSVDLRFEAQGERREDIRALVIESVFRQKFGRFSGRVLDHEIEGAFGLVEDHRSTW